MIDFKVYKITYDKKIYFIILKEFIAMNNT